MTSTTLLTLPEVTLCCIDSTPLLPWALEALQHSIEQVKFGDAMLCADRASLGGRPLPEGVRWVEIGPLRSIEAYSHFILKSLLHHVRTPHVLIIQWDGYVVEAANWRPAFLDYDYIGAPWHHIAPPSSVGNGGFSLRSLKLLRELQAPEIIPSHPEDICICQTYRAQLESRGVRFAPQELARKFAVEDEPMRGDVFGFHGPYHLPRLLPPEKTLAVIEALGIGVLRGHYFGSLLREMTSASRADVRLQPAMVALQRLISRGIAAMPGDASLSPQALGLCKALIRHGQYALARELLQQRSAARAANGEPAGDAGLRWRLNVHWLLSSLKTRRPPSPNLAR